MSVNDQRNPILIEDVFRVILDCLCRENDPAEGTLASLARSCRATSGPSLDFLWRKLVSLEPLILCYAGVEDVDNPPNPTPAQLNIIGRYSHRVRELTIYGDASLRFLQCTRMLPPLQFRLRTLKWNPTGRPIHIPITFIQQFLGASLVSLEASLSEEDGGALLSFFDSYPVKCRNLKSINFHFTSGAPSETTIHTLSRAICSQDTLQKVTIDAPINEIALRHLSTLPNLKIIFVNVSKISSDFEPISEMFCGVEELSFAALDLELVTSLLQPRNQKFHSLSLRCNNRLTSEATATLLGLLANGSQTESLRNFTLSYGNVVYPLGIDQAARVDPRYRLSYQTLQPLAVFGSLRELTIEWVEHFSLDDGELAKLTSSWPSLQVFSLHCWHGPPYSTKYPTLRSLLTLVKHCPKLEALNLSLDARGIPEVEKEEEPHETKFECTGVPTSPVGQALPVAEFLFKYLPTVTQVDAMVGLSTQAFAYERAWQEVELRLLELQRLLSDAESVGLGTISDSESAESEGAWDPAESEGSEDDD